MHGFIQELLTPSFYDPLHTLSSITLQSHCWGSTLLHFSGLAGPKSMAPLFLPFLSHILHVSPVVALLSSKLSKQHLFVCASAKDNTRVSEGMPPGTFLELDGNFCPVMGRATVGSLFGTYTDLTSPRSASLTSRTIPQHSLTTRCKGIQRQIRNSTFPQVTHRLLQEIDL